MSDTKQESSSNAEPQPILASTPNEKSNNNTPADSSPAPVNAMSVTSPAVNLRAQKKAAVAPKRETVPKKIATKAPKADKPKIKPNHPPFFSMITEAIRKLNERSGSSRQAILKFIVANFKVEEKSGNQHVKVSLKNAVKAGSLKQVKGVGASGSFKLTDALKSKAKASAEKQVAPKAKTDSAAPTKAKKKPLKKVTASVTAKKVTEAPAKVKKNAPKKKTAVQAKIAHKKSAASKARATKGNKNQSVKTVTKQVTKQAAKSKTFQASKTKRQSPKGRK